MSSALIYQEHRRAYDERIRRAYDERIREVEHRSFSLLVFSTAGGMGATANVVYKRIASLIAEKHGKSYSKTINWLNVPTRIQIFSS
jgi:hypothetical protein